jgi:hypothetical protein
MSWIIWTAGDMRANHYTCGSFRANRHQDISLGALVMRRVEARVTSYGRLCDIWCIMYNP